MKKRNLILPVFLGSLFAASNVYSAVFDLYEQQNNNLLIAEGGCGGGGGGGGGGMNIKQKREKDLKKAVKSLQFFLSKKAKAMVTGESTEEIDKKIEKYRRKIDKIKARMRTPEERERVNKAMDIFVNQIAENFEYENRKETQEQRILRRQATQKKILKNREEFQNRVNSSGLEAVLKELKVGGRSSELINKIVKLKKEVILHKKKIEEEQNPEKNIDFFTYLDSKYQKLKQLEIMISFLDLLIYESANMDDYTYLYDDGNFTNKARRDALQLEVTIRRLNVFKAKEDINDLNIEKNSVINGIYSSIMDLYLEFNMIVMLNTELQYSNTYKDSSL